MLPNINLRSIIRELSLLCTAALVGSMVRQSALASLRLLLIAAFFHCGSVVTSAAELLAGVSKIDITDYEAGPVNDPLYARVLLLKSGEQTVILMAIDAVAIGEIGRITNDFLPNVRKRIESELSISPSSLIVNASHCHGIVRTDLEELAFEAVRAAGKSLVPVRCGVGTGFENQIQENRRLVLQGGKVIDVRHAYSLPPDAEVEKVGPIDPEIGILRLDRMDGTPLALVYNFACHPIQGVPGGANTADIIGYASEVIEQNLGAGSIALFLQGCGGDINPVAYKAVDHPRSAEPLGHRLGLATLKAARKIECKDDSRLAVIQETLTLPRIDATEKIFAMEAQQKTLLQSLRGTSLNLKNFLPLSVKYSLSEDFPSADSHRYLQESAIDRKKLKSLDEENRRNLNAYVNNIQVMEELTRNQTNLALLRKHHASLIASGKRTVDVEVSAIRVGDFVLTSFPGELTVEIGLGIKQRSPHKPTFVAGYTNGYIYYCPTVEQMKNIGNAQEDSDCILDPKWQAIYDQRVDEMLSRL
jgi:hypothetical protein